MVDVLFGDYPFIGKLPYIWPRTNAQMPIKEYNSSGKIGWNALLFLFSMAWGSHSIEWIEVP